MSYWARAFWIAYLCAAWSPLSGQPVTLTERQALEMLREGPLYRELRARVAVIEAEAQQRTRLPNPSFSYAHEGAGRTDFFEFGQSLPLNGRLGILKRAGASAVAVGEAQEEHERLQIEGTFRAAFYRLLYTQQFRDQLHAAIGELDELVQILRYREQEGEGSRFDLLRAEREASEERTTLAGAKVAVAQAQSALASFLAPNINSAAFEASGTLDPTYPLAGLDDVLRQALPARSDYRVESERLEQLSLESKAAKRLRIPNPIVSVGVMRAEALTGLDHGPVVSVAVPLPLFRKGRVEARRIDAQAESIRARRAALTARIQSEVRSAHATLGLRRSIVDDYRREAGEQAGRLRDIADVAYREGELGILELLDAYRVARRAASRMLALQFEAKLAEVEFDRVMGKEALQ